MGHAAADADRAGIGFGADRPRIGPNAVNRSAETPVGDYYAATFEALFRTIISSCITVSETICEAQGAQPCIFTVRLRAAC
jgi:predicted hydrocarbon binding protein